MNQEAPPTEVSQGVASLNEWRQGDYVLDGCGFMHVGPDEETGIAAVADEDTIGLVVVSQTCDVVGRNPSIMFCPLVEIDDKTLANVKAGRTPHYVPLENAPKDTIVADLSRMMTVSRDVVAGWTRISGFSDEKLQRKFAYALERKFGRFAFPDAFNEAISKFHGDVRKKHGADTNIGKALEALKEIRVRAVPHWEAEQIEILFFCIHAPTLTEAVRDVMKEELDKLMDKITWPAAYRWEIEPKYMLMTLDDMTGRDYADSVALDYYALTQAA